MPKIDPKRPFLAVNIAILTVSDTRKAENDKSGNVLEKCVKEAGHTLKGRVIVSDDLEKIVARLKIWIADPEIDVVIATGGTGVTGRDVTPEAFKSVYEKEIEGFGELFRMLSYDLIGTSTIQSRATGGVANGTYLFALPGSLLRLVRLHLPPISSSSVKASDYERLCRAGPGAEAEAIPIASGQAARRSL